MELGSNYSKGGGIIEVKCFQRFRSEEVITDDVPPQERLSPFPIKLIKVYSGKEFRFEQQHSLTAERDPLSSEEPEPVYGRTSEEEYVAEQVSVKAETSEETLFEEHVPEKVFVKEESCFPADEDVSPANGSEIITRDDITRARFAYYATKEELNITENPDWSSSTDSSGTAKLRKHVVGSSSILGKSVQMISGSSTERSINDGIECGITDRKESRRRPQTMKMDDDDGCHSSSKQKKAAKRDKIARKDKPFKCSFCENFFASKFNLRSHERIHTKEKPLKCSFCDKRFRHESTLGTHERIHTKEKPFQCSFCHKCFIDKSAHIRHVKIHTKEKPFKCSMCENTFSQRYQLRIHMRTHTKEKPFKCFFCEKSYGHQSTLTTHERVHRRENPFTCNFCEKPFYDRSNWVRHVRVHAKK